MNDQQNQGIHFNILLVDPNPEEFDYLKEISGLESYELLAAHDAGEALEILNCIEIDILICDWSIRTDQGARLTSHIKAIPELTGIYTFLIGERQNMSDVIRAMEKGADDVMIKPVSGDIFMTRLKVGLRQRRILEDRNLMYHQKGILETITTVAHEINNPLFAVLGNIDLLYDELSEELEKPENEFLKECIETINQQGERMAEVVRKLQTITKPKTKAYRGDQNMLDLTTPSPIKLDFDEDDIAIKTPNFKNDGEES